MRRAGVIEYEKESEMKGLQGAATTSSRMRKSKIYGRRGFDSHWLLILFSCFWFLFLGMGVGRLKIEGRDQNPLCTCRKH